jgi:uncharacterized Zn finger protein
MGYYYGFRPYVSVAERRRQAQRAIEKKRQKGLVVMPVVIDGRVIAKTFWGKAWCDNLESYSDFENRLPRGRTYVRNGSVVHLEIRPGKISAMVSGSELYSVEITIASLPPAHWKQIKTQCAGKIASLVELLQAKLSTSVMEVVTQRGEGLFPKPAEIKMKCSCPDWAGMCKHVAAVMYGIGARLDRQPELLFLLREIDHLELIASALDATPVATGKNSRVKKTIAADHLADVFGIEMVETEPLTEIPKPRATKSTTSRAVASGAGLRRKSSRTASGSKEPVVAKKAANQKKIKTAELCSNQAPSAPAKPNSRKRVKQGRLESAG